MGKTELKFAELEFLPQEYDLEIHNFDLQDDLIAAKIGLEQITDDVKSVIKKEKKAQNPSATRIEKILAKEISKTISAAKKFLVQYEKNKAVDMESDGYIAEIDLHETRSLAAEAESIVRRYKQLELCAERKTSDKIKEKLQKKNHCRLERDDVEKAMAQNPNATTYVVPEGITVIGSRAFAWQNTLTNITLPESLRVIGTEAFGGCKNLRSVTVPKNVELICDCAFSGCDALENVTLECSTPPKIGERIFEYSEAVKKIIVPEESAKIYAENTYWKQYIQKNVIEKRPVEAAHKIVGKFKEAYSKFDEICSALASLIRTQDKSNFFGNNTTLYVCKDYYEDESVKEFIPWRKVPEKKWLYVYARAYNTYEVFKFDLKKVLEMTLTQEDFENSILEKRRLLAFKDAQKKVAELWENTTSAEQLKLKIKARDVSMANYKKGVCLAESDDVLMNVAIASNQWLDAVVRYSAATLDCEKPEVAINACDFNKAARSFALCLNKLKNMHSDICDMILHQDKNHILDGTELYLDMDSYIYESKADLQKTFFAIARKGYKEVKLKFDLTKALNLELGNDDLKNCWRGKNDGR